MKYLHFFLILFVLNFIAIDSFSQCNTNTSICTSGIAGPFNFVSSSGSVSSCLDFTNGAAAPNYGFILLYITSSGPLEMQIQANNPTGFLDVAVFNVPNGVTPCAAINNLGNEIGCNFASAASGCNQFGTAFPCASTVPSPMVNAGDVLMIVIEDWSDVQTSFTLDLSPGGSQTGAPDPTITNPGTIDCSGGIFNFLAASPGGTWSASCGTCINSITGAFDPSLSGTGAFTITYDVGITPCDAQDVINFNVTCLPPVCTITALTAVSGACNTATNLYNLSGSVSFSTPPTTGTLTITNVCTGADTIINAPFVSPQNWSISGLTSDGAACDITAVFSADPTCDSTINYTAPMVCSSPPPGCAFTSIAINVGTCNPNSTYNISGTLTFNNPPTAGTLTISNVCSGTDTIINGPFVSPFNWTISDLPTGTGTCDVSAVFSANPACTISFAALNGGIGYPIVGLPNANANVDDSSCTLTYNLNATGTGAWTSTAPAGIAFSNANSATSTVTVPSVGSYTFIWTETNAMGCSASDSVDITFREMNISKGLNDVTCFGGNDGNILATGNNGFPPYSYQWDAAAGNQITPLASNLSVGSYTVSVTDAFGCTLDSTFTIIEPVPFAYTINTINANCNLPDGSITIIGFSGGVSPYTYDFGSGASASNAAANLTPGTYTVTITDASLPIGCDTVFDVIVGNTPAFIASITSFTDALCKDSLNGTATANGSNPLTTYSFLWYDAGNQLTPTATGLGVGTYNVELTDLTTLCKDTATVTIAEPTQVIVTAPDMNICTGQTATLTATGSGGDGGPYTYSWDGGIFIGNPYSVTPTTNTTYTVIAIDNINGCRSLSINVAVMVSPVLIVTTSINDTICVGESATIQGFGSFGNGNPSSYIFTWDNNLGNGPTQTVFPTTTTTYTVTLNDGCTNPPATAQVTVVVNPLPPVLFNVDNRGLCERPVLPFEFTTDTTGGLFSSILWNFGDGSTNSSDTVIHTYAGSGVYEVSLTLTDTNGCTNTLIEPAYVEVYNNPIADFSIDPNPTSMFDPTMHFTDESTAFSPPMMGWNWDIAGLDSSILQNVTYTFVEDTGNYEITLIVTDAKGCKDTTTRTAIVTGEFGIYVPNAFTPDGDDLNDGFFPLGFGITNQDYTFIIVDRWGEVIFESHQKFVPWNGTFKGKLVLHGIYVWKLFFKDINGDAHNRVGHVTVIR